MTFLGKILVVVNLVMSCIFMAFAVMVQTARLDMKAQRDKASADVSRLTSEKNNLNDEKSKLDADYKAQQEKHKQEMATADAELKKRQGQIEQFKAQLAQHQQESGAALTEMKTAQTQQAERTTEVTGLKARRDELMRKTAELTTQKADLQDKLTQSNNDLESLRTRNQQLEERFKELSQYVMRRTGSMPDDVELKRAAEGGPPPPPDVRGIVNLVDQTGRFIELSIGEDDGLLKGQELEVWRTKPDPKYIGKVRIMTTYPTKSVAQPVSSVRQIQKGDEVGPRIFVNR